MRTTSIAALALALAACKPAPRADDPAVMQAHADSVKAGIDAMNLAFAAHMKAGHVDSMVAMYAADATVMPPNMAPMHGTAAIKAGFTGMAAQGAPTLFTLTATSVGVSGDLAIERGRYRWDQMGPNHQMVSDSGKYMVHWHKVGNAWLIMDDIWNSDNPPMAMPAAPAPARHS